MVLLLQWTVKYTYILRRICGRPQRWTRMMYWNWKLDAVALWTKWLTAPPKRAVVATTRISSPTRSLWSLPMRNNLTIVCIKIMKRVPQDVASSIYSMMPLSWPDQTTESTKLCTEEGILAAVLQHFRSIVTYIVHHEVLHRFTEVASDSYGLGSWSSVSSHVSSTHRERKNLWDAELRTVFRSHQVYPNVCRHRRTCTYR